MPDTRTRSPADRVVCPVCPGRLREAQASSSRNPVLFCDGCTATYRVERGMPILLMDDDNWRKKADEIVGEHAFNVQQIPPEVHAARIRYADANTAEVLSETGVDLREKSVLSVGCSYDELRFLAPRCGSIVCSDIVPSLGVLYVEATRKDGIRLAMRHLPGSYMVYHGVTLRSIRWRRRLRRHRRPAMFPSMRARTAPPPEAGAGRRCTIAPPPVTRRASGPTSVGLPHFLRKK